MLVYLDSSALVKRGIRERETIALNQFLGEAVGNGDELVSSSLAVIEVSRALRSRLEEWDPAQVARQVDVALSGVAEHALIDTVLALARRIEPRGLRSLDAIHLASAILLDADLVVGYDDRLLAAAEEHGLRTVSPGR